MKKLIQISLLGLIFWGFSSTVFAIQSYKELQEHRYLKRYKHEDHEAARQSKSNAAHKIDSTVRNNTQVRGQ